MTALLSLAAGWCKEKMLPGAVTVHRQCGLTPDSSNGSMMLWSLIKELSLSYNASKNSKQVAKHKFQTKKIKKNLNPIWDEQCAMKDLVRTDKMLLTVWDYDLVGKNDLLGQVEIPLAKIELNTPIEKWFAVPMELAPEKPPPVLIFFDVVV
ncbi:MAG: C2 domain-containing protein, partial [Promethearchaeia archaeon]